MVVGSAAHARPGVATKVATAVDLVLVPKVESGTLSLVGAHDCEPGFLTLGLTLGVVTGPPPVVLVGQPAGGQHPDRRVSRELPNLLPGGVELTPGRRDVAFQPREVRIGVVGVAE